MKIKSNLFFFKLILSKLSISDIKNVVDQMKNELKDHPDILDKSVINPICDILDKSVINPICDILDKSVINPIFGFLFESIGAINNLRFYGPGLKYTIKNNTINHAEDESDDPLTNLLIELFPSPTGTLCYIRNKSNNFGYKFSKNKKKGIVFLSDMFVQILKTDTNRKLKTITNGNQILKTITNGNHSEILKNQNEILKNQNEISIESVGQSEILKNQNEILKNQNEILKNNTIEFRTLYTSFKEIQDLLINSNDLKGNPLLKDKTIKLMIIHSFIINALDNKEDLKDYLKLIISNISIGDIRIFDAVKFDVIEQVEYLQKLFVSFPYSELNLPPSNDSIPMYNRKKDSIDKNSCFSDCADILLLNLCNCLFYDPEKQCYSTGNLDENLDLVKFYRKHNRLYTITRETRNEWSKVIQDLEDFDTEDESIYKINKIVYVRKQRNEIKAGILNMMNVLIKICNIDHNSFWEGFNGLNINNKLNNLFQEISKITNKKIELNLYSDLEHFKSKDDKADFTGEFELNFNTSNGQEFIISIKHISHHAEMKFISCVKNKVNYENIIYNTKDSGILPIQVLNRFTRIAIDRPIENESMDLYNLVNIDLYDRENIDLYDKVNIDLYNRENTYLYNRENIDLYNRENMDLYDKIYFSGYIETHDQKLIALNVILNKIAEYVTNEETEVLKSNENDILNEMSIERSESINDEYIKGVNDKYTKGVNDEYTKNIIDEYNRDKYPKGVNDEYNHDKYNRDKYNRQIETLKRIASSILKSVDLSDNATRNIFKAYLVYYEDLSFDEYIDCWTKSFSSTAKSFNKLYEIEILKRNIKELNLDIYSLSYPLENFQSIFNTIKKISSLRSLKLEWNRKDENVKYIIVNELKQLSNLTSFDIEASLCPSCNYLSEVIESLKGLKNLISLNLSCCFTSKDNLNNSRNLVATLNELPNLKTLKLAKNYLGPVTLSSFLNCFKNLNSLIDLDLSSNSLNSNCFMCILKDFNNLVHLNISGNNLGSDFDESAISGLELMTRLISLDISGNNLRSEGIIKIANAIKNFTSIENLNISHNSIGLEGIKAISNQISSFNSLVNFDISINIINEEGAIYLANGLSHLKRLNSFKIGHNDIGFNGIKQILRALGSSVYLNHLSIECTGIDNDISEEIKDLKHLEHLDISQNSLGDEKAKILFERIKELKHMKFLKFNLNRVSDEITEEFIQTYAYNHYLEVIY